MWGLSRPVLQAWGLAPITVHVLMSNLVLGGDFNLLHVDGCVLLVLEHGESK